MALVLGVGAGIWILGFLWGFVLLCCVISASASGGVKYIGPGVFAATVIVTIILLTLPRQDEVIVTTAIVDEYFILRYVLVVVASLCFLCGLIGYLIHLTEPIYAKPLKNE